MIGWGIRTYAPIHDHPIGGCLAKVVKGPGLIETHYWKPKQRPYQQVKDPQGSHPSTLNSRTKLYKCIQEHFGKNSHGCELKNQTLAWITELKKYHMTRTNFQVMYQEGYDYMHSVTNPHSDKTLTLHHYYGDYHISFWEEV